MATRDVFSEEELAQLRGFPEISRAELIRYFTLTPVDEAFLRTFRGGAQRARGGGAVVHAAVAGVRAGRDDRSAARHGGPAVGALAVTMLRRAGRHINDEVVAHLWPTHHANIHFCGTHTVDINGELAKLNTNGYRPPYLPELTGGQETRRSHEPQDLDG